MGEMVVVGDVGSLPCRCSGWAVEGEGEGRAVVDGGLSPDAAIVSTLMPYRDNPVGYVVAERVAADHLADGRTWWPMP
jgi:hypothetical protein